MSSAVPPAVSAARRHRVTGQQLGLPGRFCGPPGSANGGYACGVVGSALAHRVEVTLHVPPPLEVELSLEVGGGTSHLLAQGVLVASAREVDVAVPTAPPPSFERVLEASAQFDLDSYSRSHAYPGCLGGGLGKTGDPCAITSATDVRRLTGPRPVRSTQVRVPAMLLSCQGQVTGHTLRNTKSRIRL